MEYLDFLPEYSQHAYFWLIIGGATLYRLNADPPGTLREGVGVVISGIFFSLAFSGVVLEAFRWESDVMAAGIGGLLTLFGDTVARIIFSVDIYKLLRSWRGKE